MMRVERKPDGTDGAAETRCASPLCFKPEELFSNEDHVAGFKLDFAFDLDEGPISAALVRQHEAAAAANDPCVPSGHKSIMGKCYAAGSPANNRLFSEVVDLPRLTALHDQAQFSLQRRTLRCHYHGS